MGTSSWLATWLDYQFLIDQGAIVYQARQVSDTLPERGGEEVARELGGRKLLRYLLPEQVGSFRNGSTQLTFVTPTAYGPEEALIWLVLPASSSPRTHVLILEPSKISAIIGPIEVAAGRGIQYILPRGFPPEAIIVPGAPGAAWEVVVA